MRIIFQELGEIVNASGPKTLCPMKLIQILRDYFICISPSMSGRIISELGRCHWNSTCQRGTEPWDRSICWVPEHPPHAPPHPALRLHARGQEQGHSERNCKVKKTDSASRWEVQKAQSDFFHPWRMWWERRQSPSDSWCHRRRARVGLIKLMENTFKIKMNVQLIISVEFTAVRDHWKKHSDCIFKDLNSFTAINNFVSHAI